MSGASFVKHQKQRFCVDYGTNDVLVGRFRDMALFCQFSWFASRTSCIGTNRRTKRRTLDVAHSISPLQPQPRQILSLVAHPRWAIPPPPTRSPVSVKDNMWSEMLESVRKDVECSFGILKGCFRVPKFPVPYRSKEGISITCSSRAAPFKHAACSRRDGRFRGKRHLRSG